MGLVIAKLAFPAPPRDKGHSRMQHRVKFVTTQDGNKIPLYHRAVADAPYTIIFSHANAEDLFENIPFLVHMSRCVGASVLGYEYAGYSLSRRIDDGNAGTASEEACYRAHEAALQYLVAKKGVPRDRIVLFGRSIGTGPCVDLASREPDLAGVILLSPMVSVLRTVLPCKLADMLQSVDMFTNLKKVGAIRCPVFLIHGVEDVVVPFADSERLLDELTDRGGLAYPPWWIEGVGHHDIDTLQLFEKIREFLLTLDDPDAMRVVDSEADADGAQPLADPGTPPSPQYRFASGRPRSESAASDSPPPPRTTSGSPTPSSPTHDKFDQPSPRTPANRSRTKPPRAPRSPSRAFLPAHRGRAQSHSPAPTADGAVGSRIRSSSLQARKPKLLFFDKAAASPTHRRQRASSRSGVFANITTTRLATNGVIFQLPWALLSEVEKAAAVVLGSNQELWDLGIGMHVENSWASLPDEVREAATTLGFTEEEWDGKTGPHRFSTLTGIREVPSRWSTPGSDAGGESLPPRAETPEGIAALTPSPMQPLVAQQGVRRSTLHQTVSEADMSLGHLLHLGEEGAPDPGGVGSSPVAETTSVDTGRPHPGWSAPGGTFPGGGGESIL